MTSFSFNRLMAEAGWIVASDGDEEQPERERRPERPRDDARRSRKRGEDVGRPPSGRRAAGGQAGRSDFRRLGDGERRHAGTGRTPQRAAPGPERRGPDRRTPPAGTDRRPQRQERAPRDEPALPESVQPRDLDRGARIELKSLTKENADVVARHLVMAARLLEDDPAAAQRHAQAAASRAGRIAVVREALAIAAYANGDFALAVRELRTVRRISGSDDQIALLVDSERGLGKPEHALETGRAVDRAKLPIEAQVGLAIAMSGARLDLGDPRAALEELERAPLSTDRVFPWSPELFTAFATVHEELGDEREAARWHALADRARSALDAAAAEFSEVEVVEEVVDDPQDPES